MNVLVTGCYGQLGTEMRKLAASDQLHRWYFTDIDTLDICDSDAVECYFTENNIDICVNCAAYTAVDRAEDEPELAEKVNVTASKTLAESCKRHQSLLVHVSTDYVFDGQGDRPYREDDSTGPTSVYGKTKLEGEKVIQESDCRYCIVRTAWLYSSTGKNFVKTMLSLADTRDSINVVCDQKGTPTWAGDLADAIMHLINRYATEPVQEIFHFTNEGVTTWYDFTVAILDIAGKTCQVNPITTDQYPTKATRPAYSVLDKSKIKQALGIEIPFWKDSLVKCIEELKN
ncbi:MAG: dTDP-4-dehydrorhamnose reductase [Bacteroidales bacterium]|nr:dTDP-4-dehydrorhamnose reductase [Bacteroidales bacterium]